MYLAGDIGGTKTHLALFDKSNSHIIKQQKFPSKNYQTLEKILIEFLGSYKDGIEKACFGVAGPVKSGVCNATNLPWVIDSTHISEELHIPRVSLINDLEANAYGVKALSPTDFVNLQNGDKNARGNKALISAGTGLGEAGFYFDGKQHHPFACEGGHTDFGPRSSEEIELLQFLLKDFEHVSYERVLSGPGLYNLYRFYVAKGLKPKEILHDPQTAPKIITAKGLSKECPVCEKALSLFVKLYGAEAGNLALKFFALGGIYLGGGIAPNILPALQSHLFTEEFSNKGRFKKLLKDIPIYVILNPDAALLGAEYYLRYML